MLWANRNGFFYVLDRTTVSSCRASRSSKSRGQLDSMRSWQTARTVSPTADGTVVSPHPIGGTNWYSPSYSPRTGLFYVPSWMDTSATYFQRPPTEYVEGRPFSGRSRQDRTSDCAAGPSTDACQKTDGWGCSGVRPEDGRKEMGVQDDRLHLERNPDDGL